MKFYANIESKVMHGPDCGEGCNLDSARQHDNIKAVSVRAMAHMVCDLSYQPCERWDPEDDRPKDDEEATSTPG